MLFTRTYPKPCRHPTGEACHPHRDEDLANLTPLLRVEADPSGQTTVAEMLEKEGFGTYLVTDTYVQFPMNFGRGFGVYNTIRGQERDPTKTPPLSPKRRCETTSSSGRARRPASTWPTYRAARVRRTGSPPGVPRRHGCARVCRRENRPFFLVADCFDPHEPWDPPEEYVSLYDEGYEGKEPLDDNYGTDDYLTDRQLLRMRRSTPPEVTMMDRWLGKFIERAHELGVMENTLFVVVSDHGHLLGEHGYTGKLAYALYPERTDIVLMIRHPGARRQARAATTTLPPTTSHRRSLASSGWSRPTPWTARTTAPSWRVRIPCNRGTISPKATRTTSAAGTSTE